MEREDKIEIKEALYEEETEARRMDTSERLKANRLAAAEKEGLAKEDNIVDEDEVTNMGKGKGDGDDERSSEESEDDAADEEF